MIKPGAVQATAFYNIIVIACLADVHHKYIVRSVFEASLFCKLNHFLWAASFLFKFKVFPVFGSGNHLFVHYPKPPFIAQVVWF
jgi:hypothetical protein